VVSQVIENNELGIEEQGLWSCFAREETIRGIGSATHFCLIFGMIGMIGNFWEFWDDWDFLGVLGLLESSGSFGIIGKSY
jgi:hypothetical protein